MSQIIGEIVKHYDQNGNLLYVTDTAQQVVTVNEASGSGMFLIIVALAVIAFLYLVYKVLKPVSDY